MAGKELLEKNRFTKEEYEKKVNEKQENIKSICEDKELMNLLKS